MNHEDVLVYIKSWDLSLAKKLANEMNKKGVVSELDGLDVSSVWLKHWGVSCTQYLRTLGYSGGEIDNLGHFFDGEGVLYVIYDSERYGPVSARDYIFYQVE